MSADPSITIQKAARPKSIPAGKFVLIPGEHQNRCRYCMGTTKIAVMTQRGVAGYLVSEFPWWSPLGESQEHPQEPHYEVEWHAESAAGEVLYDLNPVTALAVAADLIVRKALAGEIEYGAKF